MPVNDGSGINAGQVRVYGFTTTGVTENRSGRQCSLYPNPTTGPLSIDLVDNMLHVTVVVRNTLGRKLLRKTSHTANLIELTIEGAAGVYFVEIAAMHKTELLKVIKK